MLKSYPGYVMAGARDGDRIAFLVSRDEPNKVLKTYFVHDPAYEADDDDVEDDDTEKVRKSASEDTEDTQIPDDLWHVMNLSSFNKELFFRIWEKKNWNLLRLAEPPSELQKMKWGLEKLGGISSLPTKVNEISSKPESQSQEITLSSESPQIFITASAIPTFRVAVPGPTGVGKSVWVAKRCETYRMEYPWNERLERKKKKTTTDSDEEEDSHRADMSVKDVNHRINIFSFFDHDPAYDNIDGLFYIKLDKKLLDQGGLDQDMFKHSLCVFDDVDALTGPLREVVLDFRDQCLKTGRKKDISCVSILHEMFGGISTRPTWKESEELVVFPRADTSNIIKLLATKYSMPKDEISLIVSQKCRSVLLKRTHPRIMLTRKTIKVLK